MKEVFIGRDLKTNQKIFHKEDKSLIIEAATRLGFSSSIIIPTLLENESNILILGDCKREIYQLTKEYRKKIGHKILKLNKETPEEEIENILSEKKFTIYVEIDILNFFNNESNIFYTKIFKKLLKTIKDKKINCLTIIEEFPAIFASHKYLLDYKCENNKFLLRVQTLKQLDKLNSMTANKIKIEDFDSSKMDFYNSDIIIFKDKTYKKGFYFKNKDYLKMLNLIN